MPTDFPTSVDTSKLPNPDPDTAMNDDTPYLAHDLLHTNVNDAIKAIQIKIGQDGSIDTTNLSGRISKLSSGNSGQVLKKLTGSAFDIGWRNANHYTTGSIPYAASLTLDYDGAAYQTVALTGNTTIATTNRGAGKTINIKFAADTNVRSVTFNASIKCQFNLTVPLLRRLDIPAGKTVSLWFVSYGGTETDTHVACDVEVETAIGIIASACGLTPLTIRGAISQTADLTQWQNNSGAVVASMTPSGIIAASFCGNGSLVTAINANNIASGTLADARLSGAVALKAGTLTNTRVPYIDVNGKLADDANFTFNGAALNVKVRTYQSAPSSAPSDGNLSNNQISLYLDETNKTVKIRAKKSDGSLFTQTIQENGNAPIGVVVGWLKSFAGTPSLPSSWAECNGQSISDVDSPYNGTTVPNLNASGGGVKRFLRGNTTSGTTGGADTVTPAGTVDAATQSATVSTTASGTNVSLATHTHAFTGTNASYLPSYYEVVWVVRIK